MEEQGFVCNFETNSAFWHRCEADGVTQRVRVEDVDFLSCTRVARDLLVEKITTVIFVAENDTVKDILFDDEYVGP